MISHKEHEILLNGDKLVFKPDFKDTYSKWLYPGRHEYKFAYDLPITMPYSLDGSKYGRIEYKSKAEVIVMNSKPVESLEEEFFLHSKSEDGVEEEYLELEKTLPKKNVEYGFLGGGCFVKKSQAEIFLELPRNVYTVQTGGEDLPGGGGDRGAWEVSHRGCDPLACTGDNLYVRTRAGG